MEYSVFDTLLDSVIVIDAEKKIVYANECVSALCDLPRRKLKPGVLCHEVITFDKDDLLCMPGGTWGKDEATQYREMGFTAISGRKGVIQITIQPVIGSPSPGHWAIFMRDVRLEALLQQKYRAEFAEKEGALVKLQKAHEELEDYSKNLEKKVQERTLELSQANRLLQAILNSLGQGFLMFDKDGICLPVYSRACESILEKIPASKPIAEVLSISAAEQEGFDSWCKTLFLDMIPFEDLVSLGPKTYEHSKGRQVVLEYNPLKNEYGHLEGVVLVATDKTDEFAAMTAAKKEHAYVTMVLRIVRNRNQFFDFVEQACQNLNGLREKAGSMKRIPDDAAECLRVFHTIKGGAGMFMVTPVQDLAHHWEERLMALFTETAGDPQILEHELMQSVNGIERALQDFFVEHRNVIGRDFGEKQRSAEVPVAGLKTVLQELKAIPGTDSVRIKIIEDFLKEPIQSYFTHYGDSTRELAMMHGKKVDVHFEGGGDVKVIVDPYEDLFASFVHAFRNSVDHGLELPEERTEAGKPSEGLITVKFMRKPGEQNWLVIQVKDDGRGIDPHRIREKLTEKGLGSAAEAEDDDEVIQHVFDSGLSTKDEVTLTSGRGVGMEAIAAAARKLGGTARVISRVGKGTTLVVIVPECDPFT